MSDADAVAPTLAQIEAAARRLAPYIEHTPVFHWTGPQSGALFGADTVSLAREMVASGLRSRITCVNPAVLDRSFAGREFDAALLRDLPDTIDPCGERGEFHTFAYAGPMFARPIPIESGVVVERDGFVFADVLPAGFHTARAVT